MAVLITNAQLAARYRAAAGYDAHGYPLPGTYGAATAAAPGLIRERGDGTWGLNVDPALWPLREHDLITDPATGREWLVLRADLLTNAYDSTVDHVRVEGRERVGAATEPGGEEFAAR